MMLPPILAHGELGRFDEMIFLSVAAIFIAIMGIAWIKSRNTLPELDERQEAHGSPTEEATQPDRFPLD